MPHMGMDLSAMPRAGFALQVIFLLSSTFGEYDVFIFSF
jgi:hypothetical protein